MELQAGKNNVTFKSQGVNLSGLLFTPENFDTSKKYPTIVFSGPFNQVKEQMETYYRQNQLEEKGIPSVEWLASQLNISHRYMSDTIKAETGKTAIDQINLYLIEQAKNLLLTPNVSISETAYKLGFEYPQYFSRIFKKKVGLSPKQFIEKSQIN